ncbi:MAG: inositol monophosphatase family protein [Pseudomonadota bacterium]
MADIPGLSGVSADALRQFLSELCDASEQIAMRYFRTPIPVEHKEDTSPVTQADREVEQCLRGLIASRFPDHGILGEEFGGPIDHSPSAPLWVLDPIDGTKNFVSGKPLFGTLIGLCLNAKPVAGVINMPALKERWIAPADGKTYGLSGPAHARDREALADASLHATSPDMFDDRERRRFDELSAHVSFRAFGTDCYGYALLAEGFVDIVMEASLAVHDFCALLPVITGAGGVMTDWEGNELTLNSPGQVLAAGGPRLHRDTIAAIATS